MRKKLSSTRSTAPGASSRFSGWPTAAPSIAGPTTTASSSTILPTGLPKSLAPPRKGFNSWRRRRLEAGPETSAMHHFAYRDGVLHAEAVNLEPLAEAGGHPVLFQSTPPLEPPYRLV